MSVFSEKGIEIKLGSRTYTARPLKYRRVFVLKDFLIETLQEADKLLDLSAVFRALAAEKPNVELGKIDAAITFLLGKAGEFFAIAIPEIDPQIFSPDVADTDSPDIEQILEAFNAILEVNHLQMIKNHLGLRPSDPQATTATTKP